MSESAMTRVGVADGDLDRLNLDVYDTKSGLWCPEHGDLELPEGWELLAAGDNFVTRRVNANGVYWTLWRPRGRNRPHRRKIGVLAPSSTIDAARAEAVATAERRAAQRVVNSSARQRAVHRHRSTTSSPTTAPPRRPSVQPRVFDVEKRGALDQRPPLLEQLAVGFE
jgi:hypothetical protein